MQTQIKLIAITWKWGLLTGEALDRGGFDSGLWQLVIEHGGMAGGLWQGAFVLHPCSAGRSKSPTVLFAVERTLEWLQKYQYCVTRMNRPQAKRHRVLWTKRCSFVDYIVFVCGLNGVRLWTKRCCVVCLTKRCCIVSIGLTISDIRKGLVDWIIYVLRVGVHGLFKDRPNKLISENMLKLCLRTGLDYVQSERLRVLCPKWRLIQMS